jgi:DNA-binding CsgD family transcriptional regulator
MAKRLTYRRIFVGRETELVQLQAAFERAADGQAELVLVAGEPGIGKTALCEQLITYAVGRGGRALVGHCYEEGSRAQPYLPFVQALRTYLLAGDPAGLHQDLGSEAATLAWIVPEIRGRVAGEAGAPGDPAPGDPEEERWRLFEAVTACLRTAAATQPTVLVLEDLHWADLDTLELWLHLARRLQDTWLLVVGTYRDREVDRAHPLSRILAELRRLGELPRLALRGLTVSEIRDLAQGVAGQGLSRALAAMVHRQTEGNPLFVQEVVRDLVEEGQLAPELLRRHTVETSNELRIPDGLRDVIGRRLARLSPACSGLLPLAAVIGREFRLDTLTRVAGLADESVIAGLEEATRGGVLEEQPGLGPVRYRFAHALFRQTLYEEISAPRRQRVHQEVAQALEQQYAGRTEAHSAELAEHYAHATDLEDLEKAVRYGELAAQQSMAVYAYGEAVLLLEQAMDVQAVADPKDLARRCDLLLALADALMPAGEPHRAYERVAEEAFMLSEQLGDRARAEKSCLIGIEALYRFGSVSAFGTPAYRTWAERLDRYATPGTRSRVYADAAMSEVHRGRGQLADARRLIVRCVDAARQLDEPEALFWAAVTMLTPAIGPGYQAEQLRLAHDLATRPRDGVRTATLAGFLRLSQITFLAAGERDAAEAIWAEMRQLAARSHDPPLTLMPLVVEALRAILDGDLEGAVRQAKELADRGEAIGSPLAGRHWASNVTQMPLLYLGRLEELERIGIPLRGSPSPLPVLTRALLGRRDEAHAALQPWIERAGDPISAREIPPAYMAHSLEAALVLGDTSAVALLSERLGNIVAGTFTPWAVVNVARATGAAAAFLGDAENARNYYERALDWATKIRHRPEIALTRLAIAELLLADHPEEQTEAQAHLDFAFEELHVMGMQPALERALRLREDLHGAAAPRPRPAYPGGLSAREVEVLRLVAAGKSNQQIADTLVISLNTVLRHLSHIFAKLGVANRAEAATYASRHGLLPG